MSKQRPSTDDEKFWKILTQTPVPAKKFPLNRVEILEKKAASLYLLEFLITDTLAALDKASKWYISRVGPDGGIDFESRSPVVNISLFDLKIDTTLIGQVKRMKKFREETLSSEMNKIHNIRRYKNISAALFIISSECDGKKIKEMVENRRDNYTYLDIERYFMDVQSFMRLWACHKQYLCEVLNATLPGPDAIFIYEGILRRGTQLSLGRTNALKLQAAIITRLVDQGVAFRVTIHVEFPCFLSLQTIRLKHEHAITSTSLLTAIRPSQLHHPEGASFQFRETMHAHIDIWFRAETAGSINLGQIYAWGAGEYSNPVHINLGSVTASPQFFPSYFPDPHINAAKKLEKMLSAARVGQTTSAFILGAGGAGKTALCNATIDYAFDNGFRVVRLLVSDVTNPNIDLAEFIRQVYGPHQAFGVPDTDDILNSISAMIGVKQTVLAEMRDCLEFVDKQVQPRTLSIGLCALFVRSLQTGPLIVHIQNMHWSSKQLLDTLGQVILGLQDAEISSEKKRLPNGVLFLLEGRIGEARRAYGDRLDIQPWLDFQETSKFLEVHIHNWNLAQSRQFITRLIPERISTYGTSDELREKVVEYVERRGCGSPMHIIEQVRLLYDEETLCYDLDGHLSVKKSLLAFRPVPNEVDDVIMARWHFLYSKSPNLAEILALLAKTGHINDQAYVEYLLSNCVPPLSSSDIDKTGCIFSPRHGLTAYEFLHENYVETFSKISIDGHSPLLERAIFWHDMPNVSQSIRWSLNLVKLLLLHWRPPYCRIIELSTYALAKARKARSSGEIETALRCLLRVPHDQLREVGILPEKLHYDLAVCLAWSSSWEAALDEFDNLYATCKRDFNDINIKFMMAEIAAEKANILVDLQRTCEALDAVEQGTYIAAELREHILDANQLLRLENLEEKLLHRKAVGLWFDGQRASAAIAQRTAWLRARNRNDPASLAVILREAGTLMLHGHACRGYELLRIATKMSDEEKNGVSHVDCMVNKIQFLMAELIVMQQKGCLNDFHLIAIDLMKLHDTCAKEGLGYEPALAALLAGAAEGMIKKYERAHSLFRIAVIQASQSRLKNIMWQSRLNLAQVALQQRNTTDARRHANNAVEIIKSGIEKAASPIDRLALMALPLRQALRCKADREREWINEQLSKLAKSQPQITPLHLSMDENSFFLMN